MKTKKQTISMSIAGDLDGMTVGSLKEFLSDLPDDAKIIGKTEYTPSFGGGSASESEYFVIEWEQNA